MQTVQWLSSTTKKLVSRGCSVARLGPRLAVSCATKWVWAKLYNLSKLSVVIVLRTPSSSCPNPSLVNGARNLTDSLLSLMSMYLMGRLVYGALHPSFWCRILWWRTCPMTSTGVELFWMKVMRFATLNPRRTKLCGIFLLTYAGSFLVRLSSIACETLSLCAVFSAFPRDGGAID